MADNQDPKSPGLKTKRRIRNRLDKLDGGGPVFSSFTTKSVPPPCTISKRVVFESYERMRLVLERQEKELLADVQASFVEVGTALKNAMGTVFEELDGQERDVLEFDAEERDAQELDPATSVNIAARNQKESGT